jgi:acyl carrier protein
MQNCDRWDSLQHFHLILAVEEAFGVRFSSERIPHLTSVQALREELAHVRPSR